MKTQNPWFRLYTEMVDDEKLRLLAFEDRWHYVALLCCKGKGMLDAGDCQAMLMRKISVKLGLTQRETETVLMRLSEVDLVDAETAQPKGWDDRQFISDTSTERVRTYRERMKRKGNVSVTAQDTETETDTKEEKIKSSVQPMAAPSRFDDFWSAYPNKKGKQDAEKRWKRDKLDGMADAIIAHVRMMQAQDDGWQRGYVPMGSTYLNQARWTDEPQAAPRASQPQSAPSKGMQAIMEMEGMKSGRLDEGRNSSGLPAAGVLGLGAPASPGPDAWDRHGLGGGAKPQSGVGSGSGHCAPAGRILDHDG